MLPLADVDWMRLNVAGPVQLVISTTPPLDLGLFDAAGNRLATEPFTSDLRRECATSPLAGGTYYVRVSDTLFAGSYDIAVSCQLCGS